MDEDSSAKFIGSLTKFLQSLCNGYVEFSRGVELVGHIYLNIDTGEKVDYVLHERVSKNDENSVSFTSNSFHAQPQDKKKTKEASRPDPKGSNRKVNSDDDDDIVIVDHSHSQGAVGSTNTGSVLARGMKRVGSPGFDHRHAQRPRPSPHNTSSHSYTSVNRQQSGRPSATVTSQGASHNENLNISDVKLEQISRDELLSIATHVGEGSGPPHSQTSSSSSVSRSQAQHSGMPGSTIRVGGTGDAAMWVKQEVPDDGDADNNTGWSQERDDSNSNSGSNLYPVMLHQNPAFPGSSVPGFSGHGGPSGANPFPMPGTSQDMSGLDPSGFARKMGLISRPHETEPHRQKRSLMQFHPTFSKFGPMVFNKQRRSQGYVPTSLLSEQEKAQRRERVRLQVRAFRMRKKQQQQHFRQQLTGGQDEDHSNLSVSFELPPDLGGIEHQFEQNSDQSQFDQHSDQGRFNQRSDQGQFDQHSDHGQFDQHSDRGQFDQQSNRGGFSQ